MCKQDTRACMTESVILISKRTWLARTEDPSIACLPIVPDGHGFLEAYYPWQMEAFGHVLVECKDHVTNLPELVKLYWWGILCKAELSVDCCEASVGHILIAIKKSHILVQIEGFLCTPKVRQRDATDFGHQKLKHKKMKELSQCQQWFSSSNKSTTGADIYDTMEVI